MEWIESVITTTPAGVEMIAAVLLDAAITGFQIEDNREMKRFLAENALNWDYVDDDLMQAPDGDTRVIFYVPRDAYGNETLTGVQNRLNALRTAQYGVDLGSMALALTNVDDAGWLDNWKKYFKPFRVGRHIVVRPEWESYEPLPDDIVLHMNPGHVFGTGLHQSTKLCMAALEEVVRPGDRIADFGCGSGILSILSILLGGAYAFACDIESSARDVAYENAALNGIQPDSGTYEVCIGNLLSDESLRERLRGNRFDLAVINIVADVIIALLPTAATCLRIGGTLILSGIIKERLPDVLNALGQNGFSVEKTGTMDEWAVCVAHYTG